MMPGTWRRGMWQLVWLPVTWLFLSTGAFSKAPNPVVMPAHSARIRAGHRVHAGSTSLGCLDCHRRVTTSQRAGDKLAPVPEDCSRCHPSQQHPHTASGQGPLVPCTFCHLTPPGEAPGGATAERLRFSHQRHGQHDIRCAQCHPGQTRLPDAAGTERLTSMSRCVRCHRGRPDQDGDARGSCGTCHVTDRGVMRSRFPEGELKPASGSLLAHDAGWLTRHRDVASTDQNRCTSCHRLARCQSCHDGSRRPRAIHPGDWLKLHGRQGRLDANSCASCHRRQSFCLPCHQRVGLGRPPQAAAGSWHPARERWVDGPRTNGHHSIRARRNLGECVACHQERDCVRCHATANVGGPGAGGPWGRGLKPHPSGFASSCSGAYHRNPRPCLACHGTGDPRLSRCK